MGVRSGGPECKWLAAAANGKGRCSTVRHTRDLARLTTYVVGQSDLNSIAGELVRVCRAHDVVSLDLGVRNLGNDVLVGAAHHEAVLRGVVLVLVLDDKAGGQRGRATTASGAGRASKTPVSLQQRTTRHDRVRNRRMAMGADGGDHGRGGARPIAGRAVAETTAKGSVGTAQTYR